ncbi:hypothetical protein B0H10DRAFT_2208364 [Mycena sp. CBHHK59/15]|nr:hypothetical protein B0H10DRAFT_2208364 [Mycena sp. CBHHK59/15]
MVVRPGVSPLRFKRLLPRTRFPSSGPSSAFPGSGASLSDEPVRVASDKFKTRPAQGSVIMWYNQSSVDPLSTVRTAYRYPEEIHVPRPRRDGAVAPLLDAATPLPGARGIDGNGMYHETTLTPSPGTAYAFHSFIHSAKHAGSSLRRHTVQRGAVRGSQRERVRLP